MTSIATSSTLVESINRMSTDHSLTIWAQDMSNKDGSRNWKRFITGQFKDIIAWNTKLVTPNIYEELLENKPSRLYMDVEIEQHLDINLENVRRNVQALGNEMLTNLNQSYPIEAQKEVETIFATDFKNLLIDRMSAFIVEHLPEEYHSTKPIVLSACRKNKLSFHIIYPDLIFDRHNTSMVFFLWEFRQWFRDQILLELSNSNSSYSTSTLLRALCLNSNPRGGSPTPIDRAPYGKTQQFRMFGCGKLGKAPLRIVREGDPVFPPPDFVWDFGRMWGDLTAVEKSTIFVQISIPVWFDRDYIHISPGNCDRSSALTAYRRYASKPCIFRGDRQPSASNQYLSEESPTPNQVLSNIRTSQEKITILSIDEVLLTETGVFAAVENMEDGTAVYHDLCEVENEVGVGIPSARICKQDPDFIFAYCFNCNKLMARYIKTWKFEPVYFDTDEIVDIGSNYINDSRFSRVDIDLDNLPGQKDIRLVVIDAPTSAGKTTLLKNWLECHPLKAFIFVYPTISMCTSIAKKFGIPCYLDEDFSYDHLPRQFVICLNSLKNIKNVPKTHAMILDEGGLTRYATCANTIISCLKDVLTCLERLFAKTGKVVLCQHALSQTDLDYYKNFFLTPLVDANIFKRHFVRETKV
jgi:uncharacterized phage-associated protein